MVKITFFPPDIWQYFLIYEKKNITKSSKNFELGFKIMLWKNMHISAYLILKKNKKRFTLLT